MSSARVVLELYSKVDFYLCSTTKRILSIAVERFGICANREKIFNNLSLLNKTPFLLLI